MVLFNGFRVGHSAYTGANHMKLHNSYQAALRDLLGRGVPMTHAHRALKQAQEGSHAACSTYRRGRATDPVEVVSNPVYF